MSSAASLKCNNIRYPNRDPPFSTVSVPCDGVEECEEGFDEANCNEQYAVLSRYCKEIFCENPNVGGFL